LEESFGLISGALLDAHALDDIDNGNTLVVKLLLNLTFVSGETLIEFAVFWVLLDGADGSNCCSFGANLVFESDRK